MKRLRKVPDLVAAAFVTCLIVKIITGSYRPSPAQLSATRELNIYLAAIGSPHYIDHRGRWH